MVTREGQTLLPQYLGMYRLTVNNAEAYWMVMRNVCSSTIKMHIKFDLKGSTVDRQASDKEKVSKYNYTCIPHVHVCTCTRGSCNPSCLFPLTT